MIFWNLPTVTQGLRTIGWFPGNVLSYVGFFRSEEVTSIRRNHIRFCEGYTIIKVEKSKTDQLRLQDEVVIAESGGSTCPVFILQEYLSTIFIRL